MNKLAPLYTEQEKLAEAEELSNRALAGKEKTLGRDHRSNLDTLNNPGNLHYKKDCFDQAEGIYTRALAAKERNSRTGAHIDTQCRLKSSMYIPHPRRPVEGRDVVLASSDWNGEHSSPR
ncbi:hypothetical protein RBB50_001205 [Rhinocladiella similis]